MNRKSIKSALLKVAIRRLRKVSKGSILMEVNTKEKFKKKLEKELNANEKLKGKFSIKKLDKIRPKILIYGTNEKANDKKLVKSLESQNEAFNEAKAKDEFRMKTLRGENTILNLEPNPFHR